MIDSQLEAWREHPEFAHFARAIKISPEEEAVAKRDRYRTRRAIHRP